MLDRVFPPLPAAHEDRVVVADGAMGTMLRSMGLLADDFAGHDVCHEIFGGTGRNVPPAFPEAGARPIRSNTFGADPPRPDRRAVRGVPPAPRAVNRRVRRTPPEAKYFHV